jgi:DNA-directed RNA polymerase subunit K/omega
MSNIKDEDDVAIEVNTDNLNNDGDDEDLQELSDAELENNLSKGNIKLKPSKVYDDEDEDDVEDDKNEDDEIDDDDDDDENMNDPDEDEDEDEDDNNDVSYKKNSSKGSVDVIQENEEDDDDDDEDMEDDENYLKKFDKDVKNNFLESYHPEVFSHNYEEVKMLSNVVRDENNVIIDPLHKTIPFLTKFEKSRILGQRAKQLDTGAQPFVNVEKGIIDGYVIALKELEQKVIPFIIKRPLPNGGFEYWKVSDLEVVC